MSAEERTDTRDPSFDPSFDGLNTLLERNRHTVKDALNEAAALAAELEAARDEVKAAAVALYAENAELWAWKERAILILTQDGGHAGDNAVRRMALQRIEREVVS